MRKLGVALVALAALGLASEAASAFPSAGTDIVKPAETAKADQVRYVCGPYRCWWRPNYYGYGYGYGYRPFYRPYYRPYGFYGYRRPYGYW